MKILKTLKSFLSTCTKDSSMRLCLLIITASAVLVCLTTCFIVIYRAISYNNFGDIGETIRALAFFVTGLLGPISVSKSVQKFGERNIENAVTDEKSPPQENQSCP